MVLGSLMIVVLGVVLPVFAFVEGVFSEMFANLLIQAYGAIASILLVVVTWSTLRQNRRLVEEREKDRRQSVRIDLLSEAVLPAIETVRENRSAFLNGTVDWQGIGTFTKNDGILTLANDRIDSMFFARLGDHYPEVVDEMEQHDFLLTDIEKDADILYRDFRDPIQKYIEEQNLDAKADTDSLDDIFVRNLLNQFYFPDEEPEDPLWKNHHEEIREIAEETVGEDLDEFTELKMDYIAVSQDVENELLRVRDEIQREYGISLREIQGSNRDSKHF